MKSTLRLLTLLCYFLPFTFFVVTCNGLELRMAYNKQEAKENEAAAMQAEVVDTTAANTTQTNIAGLVDSSKAVTFATNIGDSTQHEPAPNNKGELWQEVLSKILAPTETSLSAVGSIFYYKNLTGQVLVAISFLLSLMLTLRIPRNKAFTHYALVVNILCLIGFVIDSVVSDVSLRWGVWLLFALLSLQLGIESYDRRKAYR
jgi:hypothetical protein